LKSHTLKDGVGGKTLGKKTPQEFLSMREAIVKKEKESMET